jgi:uncharacterized protein (TIGR02679 family)
VTAAARIAASAGLDRLLKAAAERYRVLGRVGGSVHLSALSAGEARAIAHLGVSGRSLPHTDGSIDIDLVRVDAALAAAGGLLEVLRAGDHDLAIRADERAAARTSIDAAWDAETANAHDDRDVAWIAALRGIRGGAPPEALSVVLRALALVGGRGTWDRARLASEAAGDPHALDDDGPAAALLVAALAFRDDADPPTHVPERRALLARHGVITDPLSSTVLVSGLRVTGAGPAATLLQAADGAHLRLTLAQVASSELRACSGDVFTCEGAVVVRAAEGHAQRPLICTDGQPSTACDALLRQLLSARGSVLHSGDFDWGGIRIAAVMRRRYHAAPWRHDTATYDGALLAATGRTPSLAPPRGAPPDGYEALWASLDQRRVPIWQEDIVDLLVNDLRG